MPVTDNYSHRTTATSPITLQTLSVRKGPFASGHVKLPPGDLCVPPTDTRTRTRKRPTIHPLQTPMSTLTLPRALAFARQAVEPVRPGEGPYFGRLLRVAAHVGEGSR